MQYLFSYRLFQSPTSRLACGTSAYSTKTKGQQQKQYQLLKHMNGHAEKRAPKKVIDRVQPSDVVEFFLNYIVNDQLGRIADGHLALADASPQLANDDRCMQLVELHSTAVDFAKTGVPVDPEKVSKLLRGVQFPDYMNGLRRCFASYYPCVF